LLLIGTSVVTVGSNIPDITIADCNHEEADTRIIPHVVHAIRIGQATTVMVRTVDTDVIVILVGKLHYLRAVKPDIELWVAFGMGRDFRFISVNSISDDLGEARSKSLPVFHALSGCDTTSAFFGRSKASAWKAWELYPEITPTLEFLADHPFHELSLSSEHFKRIERFTVIMYDKLSPVTSINKARMEIFCKSTNIDMTRLPPTQVQQLNTILLFYFV
jgi:hypothetical protein